MKKRCILLVLFLSVALLGARSYLPAVSAAAAETTAQAAAEESASPASDETAETAALFAADDTAPESAAGTAEGASEEEDGLTERIAKRIYEALPSWFGGEAAAFLVSMLPVLECRGGMIVAALADVKLLPAFLICYLGNMLPIPFILLLIKRIFAFMKEHHILTGVIEKLEGKTAKNRDKVLRYKQWGLLAFVAIPLPGTGGWTGSLFAALLDVDFKKALPIIALGVFIADLIMAILSYGVKALFTL